MSTNIIVKSELIWCIKVDDETYISRYKSGHKSRSSYLSEDIDDENYTILDCENSDGKSSLIYLNRKYIFMNAITKEHSVEKGYRLNEGIDKKKTYANFTIHSGGKERYVCMRY